MITIIARAKIAGTAQVLASANKLAADKISGLIIPNIITVATAEGTAQTDCFLVIFSYSVLLSVCSS